MAWHFGVSDVAVSCTGLFGLVASSPVPFATTETGLGYVSSPYKVFSVFTAFPGLATLIPKA